MQDIFLCYWMFTCVFFLIPMSMAHMISKEADAKQKVHKSVQSTAEEITERARVRNKVSLEN